MINEAYALDIGRKIKAQSRQAMKDGDYIRQRGEIGGGVRKVPISNDNFIRLPCCWRFCTGKLERIGNSAIIESLLPRKSAFVRKAAGEPQQEQVVAANIDIVFLCMVLNNDFNLRRLERIFPLGGTAVLCLSLF